MPNQVDDLVKEKRLKSIQKLQTKLYLKRQKKKIGQILPCIIDYYDAEKHHNSCTGKTSSNTPNEKRIKKLTSDEVNILKQEGNEITYITGKKYFYYYLFKYSNHTWFN